MTAAFAAFAAAIALAAVAYAAVMGMRLRRARLALRLADAREAAFVDSARRLAQAARRSTADVRTEMQHAIAAIAPGLDAIAFFEEHDAQLTCVAASGARFAFYDGLRIALDDERSLVVRALQVEHRLTSLDARDAQRLHPGDTFALAVPLVLEIGRRCVVYAGGATADGADVADRIVRLVDQATPAYAIAIERADDRARAEYDGLTGLVAPRAFRARLAALTERVRSDPRGACSLVFVDTDRFKAWNDTYGHASGDALLRELAALLRANGSGADDIVARNGGDEFCLVYADTAKSRAIERAERLRACIAAADFSALRPTGITAPEVTISASIGVAGLPVDALTASELLEKADAAMYHSKRTGRDGVSFYGVDGALVRADPGLPIRDVADRRER